MAPGHFLYVRYFDANTIFNPAWMLQNLVSPWTYQAHLGSTHARDLSYLSIQELISVALTPVGEDLRNRTSLVATALLLFGGFLWYARIAFADASPFIRVVAAFFYASNAWVVAFIHDGYSGLLVDYGLAPVALIIVAWARRLERPALISLVPVLFLLTGMYNLTSVIVSLIVVGVFEFRYIVKALRASPSTRYLMALAFALNIFWLIPLLYDLMLHPHPAILAESAGDIAVLTQYGGLTNTVLLRSFPSIWTHAYNTRECTACAYYESPQYALAMLCIAAIAVWAFVKSRKWSLLIALVVSVVIATGFHYEDELIGLPYQILMNLPTFDAFRSNVKFSALTAMLYSVGFLYASRFWVRPRFVIGAAVVALIVAVPYVTGSFIERNTEKHFPNFVVDLPPEYVQLKQHLDLFPENAATLMLPNMPLAAYTWGAYGNDFLTPLLGKPTIGTYYLPEPNARVDGLLWRLTRSRLPAETAGLMRSMGIGRILVHDDVTNAKAVPAHIFGKAIARFGQVQVLVPPVAPFPQYWQAASTAPVLGVEGIALYGGMQGVAAVGYNASLHDAAFCARKQALVYAAFNMRKHRHQEASFTVPCNLSVRITAAVSNTGNTTAVSFSQRKSLVRMSEISGETGTRLFSAVAALNAGKLDFRFDFSGRLDRPLYILLQPIGAQLPGPIQAAAVTPYRKIGMIFLAAPTPRIVGLNQNFDPSWLGLLFTGNGTRWAQHFTVNYFANAWAVPANRPLFIINSLTVLVLVSATLSVLLAMIYLIVLYRDWRRPQSIS